MGRGGLQKGRGGHVKFYSYEKGGGAEKALAILKGGHKRFQLFKRGHKKV